MKHLSTNTAYILFGSVLLLLFITSVVLTIEAKKEQEFNTMWNDMVDTTLQFGPCGVSVQDSIEFEYQASVATIVDLPEETPVTGDHVCAFVSNDTVFIEHYHGQPYFQFLYNY